MTKSSDPLVHELTHGRIKENPATKENPMS